MKTKEFTAAQVGDVIVEGGTVTTFENLAILVLTARAKIQTLQDALESEERERAAIIAIINRVREYVKKDSEWHPAWRRDILAILDA
jgi:hypothetical protein